MIITRKETFAACYQDALTNIVDSPEFQTRPRGINCFEAIGSVIEILDPAKALYENDTRGTQLAYVASELIWYFSGSKITADITPYASFWNQIQDENGEANSAYGNLIFQEQNEHGFSEWQWAYQSLLADSDTRQAILRFNKPVHSKQGVKDFPCTMYGIFHIRENKLFFSLHMRSNDLILGTPTDIAFFTVLQLQMLELLQKSMPDLELGSYIHYADSMHVYEKHYALVKNMLKTSIKPVTWQDSIDSIGMVDETGQPTEVCKQLYSGMQEQDWSDMEINRHDKTMAAWILSKLEK